LRKSEKFSLKITHMFKIYSVPVMGVVHMPVGMLLRDECGS